MEKPGEMVNSAAVPDFLEKFIRISLDSCMRIHYYPFPGCVFPESSLAGLNPKIQVSGEDV